MRLDAATLFLVLIGFCIIAGLALVIRWRRWPEDLHLAYWSAAFGMAAVGVSGLALRGIIPDWLSIDIANMISLMAFGVAWNGVRVFGGRKPVWPLIFVAPALWMIACLVPSIYASQAYRTTVASLLTSSLCLLLAAEIWRRGPELLPARVPLAVLCLIHAFATAVRAGAAFMVARGGVLELDQSFVSLGLLEPIFVLFGVMIFGLGLTHQRREMALSRKAALDGLTGLLNRSAFVETAERLVIAARAEGRNVALLVFDIDFFKDINDTFGHAVGDETLAAFAELTRQVLRSSDPVGRLGGEEFGALLVGVDRDGGTTIAERIGAEFASRTASLNGIKVAATVSAGVAVSIAARAELSTMMVRADDALYAAKRGGRDLVSQAAE